MQLTLAPHLHVTGTGQGTVGLAWSRPQDPAGGAITGSGVLYRPRGSNGAFSRLEVDGASSLTTTITGLVDGTAYEFEVVAVSSSGDGPTSNTVSATPFGQVGTPVITPRANPGDVTLIWTEPTSGGHPGPLVYSVLLREKGSATWQIGPSGVSARTTTIPGLVNGTEYEFGVFAQGTDAVPGALGTTTVTPYGPIGTPVLSTRGSVGGLAASWTSPPTGGHTLSGYRVSLRQVGTTRTRVLATTTRSATVTGLKPGRAYRVCVTARMTDGARSAAACRTQVAGVRASARVRVLFGEQSRVLSATQRQRLVSVLPRDRGSISSVTAIGYVQLARDNSKALWLSRQRAEAVASFLRTRGVLAGTRIAGRGVGGATPAWRAVDATIRYYR